MKDSLGRIIDYLRVSVTDRCNLRCAYCVPPEGGASAYECGTLRHEEILRIVRVAREFGISHVRVTGGEPLTRTGIVDLVRGIKLAGMPDVSMTTNGVLLSKYAASLKDGGLDRVNISLDSLNPSTYKELTQNGRLEDALNGIRAALSAGLHPVKINAVLLKGVNDSEIGDLAGLSVDRPLHVRFIEVMPIGPGSDTPGLSAEDALAEIKNRWDLLPVPGPAGAGPARSFQISGAKGTVGIISPMSSPFCDGCNRLRLTPDGYLRPCLALDTEIDLKPVLRAEDTDESQIDEGLRTAFGHALELKPAHHEFLGPNAHARLRRMYQIGG